MVKLMLMDESADNILSIRKSIGGKWITQMTDPELVVDTLAKMIVEARRVDGIEPDIEYLDSIQCTY